MLQTLFISLAIIACCVALLSIRLFFGKRFVSTHVGDSPHMRRRGIGCVESRDAELRARQGKGVRETVKRLR